MENVHARGDPVPFQSRKSMKEEKTFHLLLLSRIFVPVCGKDGRTYVNEYDLKCKRAIKRCEGECPCKDTPRCRIPK